MTPAHVRALHRMCCSNFYPLDESLKSCFIESINTSRPTLCISGLFTENFPDSLQLFDCYEADFPGCTRLLLGTVLKFFSTKFELAFL